MQLGVVYIFGKLQVRNLSKMDKSGTILGAVGILLSGMSL